MDESLVLSGLPKDIFLSRYAMSNESSWEECAKRVSESISQVEHNDCRIQHQKAFFEAIGTGDFMPGGRILFGAGRPKYNMLNCYRLHPDDTIESIGQTIKDMYLISCGGGGIGFNFSSIRPKGDDIQNIKWSAPGSVSNMKMINEIGEHVRAGKNRRTALISILNVDHPDLLEFLHVKLDLHELNNFNISIGVTNEFLEAVKENKEWKFKFNNRQYHLYQMKRKSELGDDTIKVPALSSEDAIGRAKYHFRKHQNDEFLEVKCIKLMAKDIWELMIKNSWTCGDPGIYNISMANSYTNVGYFETLDSPNPCGEIPLPAYGNCCLGHVNLSNMFDENKNDVNWKKFANTIRIGIRFLDDVLSANHYPIPECKMVGEKSRRIGLGVTGLHYLLLKLGFKYGDKKCVEFLDRLFATFRNEAYIASIDLAKEKGSFPAFDASKYCKEEFFKQLPPRIQAAIKKNGIRNAVMLTIAPCGTNSMVLGVSSGVEPIFAPIYERSFRDKTVWKKEIVIDSLFENFYHNKKSLKHFVSAYDVSVEQHIIVQATIQKYIDSAISKTTNIPEDYPVDQLGQVILDYAEHVKGFTIYRTNSRGLEPLKPIKFTSEEELKDLMDKNHSYSAESISACKDGVCEFKPN